MGVVTKELADAEVKKWLDYKKVKESKRVGDVAPILEGLSEAIQDGFLVLNEEDMTFTQTLKFPIKGDVVTDKLTYQPRVTVQAVNQNMKGMKDDMGSKILATIATVTRTPKALIEGLDTEDYNTAQQIAIFFL